MRSMPMNARRMTVLGLTTLGVVVMAACLPGADRGDADLDGTVWVLRSLDSSTPIQGREITARFGEGRITGSAGCNSYGASYSLGAERIDIGEIERTAMMCLGPTGIMDQERQYLDTLGQVDRIQATESTLILAEGSAPRLVFARSD